MKNLCQRIALQSDRHNVRVCIACGADCNLAGRDEITICEHFKNKKDKQNDAASASGRRRNFEKFETEEQARRAFYGTYFGPTEAEYAERAFVEWLFELEEL